MKRRKAIKQIGLGITAGLSLPALLNACKEEAGPEIQYDGVVGIVGAGAAGLYVADILSTKGVNVIVFEASDRTGGRVRSIRQFEPDPLNDDFPTELGAQQVFGTDSIWAKMIQQLGIPVVEYPTLSTENYFLNGAYTTSAQAAMNSNFVAAKNFLDNLKDFSGGSISVQQAIQNAGLNPAVYDILNSWIANKFGTSNDRLSIKALAEGLSLLERNEQQYILSSNPMQDVLNSRFANVMPMVRFQQAVTSINYAGSKIVLSGTSGAESFTQEVDKVVVAVPVSILKNNEIVFSPSLPAAKTTALSRLGMDAVIRVALEFKKNFWGETSSFLYGGIEGPEYFNAGIGRSDFSKTLSITIGGSKAEELSPFTNAKVPILLAELDTIFDGQASENIRRDVDSDEIVSVIHDWSQQPYIKGGSSYVKPGGSLNDREQLSKPVNELIFFAGEATDFRGESGTINGALLSAERAAAEVVESIVTA